MIKTSSFGTGPDGAPVEQVELALGDMSAAVITYGATLQALHVPDAAGRASNVVLGYPDLETYMKAGGRLGATMGRFVNRMRDARFELDGVLYRLEANRGKHSIHGGSDSFDKRTWVVEAVEDQPTRSAVTLALVSPDGDQGFPGELSLKVEYALTPPGALTISYRATSDRATVVNLTNHSYFNLAGEASGPIFDHEVQVFADSFLPVDDDIIPTGEVRPVEGSVFDFREPRAVGPGMRSGNEQISLGCGYDHCFVLAPQRRPEPVDAAVLRHPASGQSMTVATTEPGVQLHSGNGLAGRHVGTGGRNYRQSDGLCLETQHFPNWPNEPSFPRAVVTPDEPYLSRTTYTFTNAPV